MNHQCGKGSVAHDIASGKELTGSDAAGASNALWPGHNWKGIKETLECRTMTITFVLAQATALDPFSYILNPNFRVLDSFGR